MRALRSSNKAGSQGNTSLVAFSNKTLGAHSHRLCWSTSGKALPLRCGRLLKGLQCYFNFQHGVPAGSCNHFVKRALNMVFQRQSSATTGRSLPRTSSGSYVRRKLSVTFCHHRTTLHQMDGSKALSTPSRAASSN